MFVSEIMLTPDQIEFVRSAEIGEMFGPARDGDSYQVYKLIDRTTASDSVHLRMMAIPDASVVGQDSAVTNFTDSIYGLLRDGHTFADVANSLNPSSNGGDVGWAREIDLVTFGSDFVKTVFNSPVGQPLKLVVPGQQLIVQVEEKTRPVNKYKVAIINMPVPASEKTSNNVDNELNQFVSTPGVGENSMNWPLKEGTWLCLMSLFLQAITRWLSCLALARLLRGQLMKKNRVLLRSSILPI